MAEYHLMPWDLDRLTPSELVAIIDHQDETHRQYNAR